MGTQPEVRQPPLWRQLVRQMRLLVALVLAGGVIGAVLSLRTPASYEASRVIVSANPETAPETFGRLTETVATTDTVLEPVISRLGLNLSTQELLESGMLRVEPVANAAVIRMIARSTDPRLAFDLADLSAQSFVSVARDRGLGNFEIFGSDVLPTDPDRPSVVLSALLGMATGGLLVFLWVLLFSFFRDPVVFEQDAGAEVGAAESFGIRMSTRSIPAREEGSWVVRPVGVLPALWRALERASEASDDAVLTCLLVERQKGGDPWMIPLVRQIVDAAPESARRPVRKVVVYRWPAPDDDEELLASLGRSHAVLLLVSEGARRSHLHDLVEILPARLGRVLVLVTSKSTLLRLPFRLKRRPKAPVAVVEPETTEDEPPPPAPVPEAQPPPPDVPRPEIRTQSPAESERADATDGNGWRATTTPEIPSPEAPPEGVAQLDHPSADVRRRALSEVRADAGPDVVDVVAGRLADPDPEVREDAVAALARMTAEPAAGLLVEAAWSEDPVVRRRARVEIGDRGSMAVARRLIDLLESRERFVETASLLIEMGSSGRAALSEALPDADGIKLRAIRALLGSIDTETGSRPNPGTP